MQTITWHCDYCEVEIRTETKLPNPMDNGATGGNVITLNDLAGSTYQYCSVDCLDIDHG